MAQSQKIKDSTPLVLPDSLATLVKAFSIDSELIAKTLIEQAAAAIYFENQDEFGFISAPKPISKLEIEEVYNLMKAINPLDIIETIYAAQIVSGHMLGMRKLAQSSRDDQRLGLKLLRLANDAMERLEKKRKGGYQNINVTYNNQAPSQQALLTSSNV